MAPKCLINISHQIFIDWILVFATVFTSPVLTAGKRCYKKTGPPGTLTAPLQGGLARAAVGVLDFAFFATSPSKGFTFGAPDAVRRFLATLFVVRVEARRLRGVLTYNCLSFPHRYTHRPRRASRARASVVRRPQWKCRPRSVPNRLWAQMQSAQGTQCLSENRIFSRVSV